MAIDDGNCNTPVSSHQSQPVTHLHRDINRRIVDADSVVTVLDIVEEASQDFNAVNISTAFHRLARMWRDLPDLTAGQGRLDSALQTLMQLAVSHIKEVQGQGLGIIIWALAKICYEPVKIRTLLQAFAQEAIDRLTEGVPKNEPNLKLGPQSLSNMVYAYAVMGHHPGTDLLAAIAQGVQGQLRDFSPQGLSNIVWAYAKLGALTAAKPAADESSGLEGRGKGNVGALLDALAVEAVSQLMDGRCRTKFIPQNLSNMVYGYAVIGHEPGAMLLMAVAQQALLQLDSFSPQELTNMVWAYAKLLPPGQPLLGPPQALLNAVPQVVVRQLADDSQHHKVKPQTVSNLLWAYATLGWAPTHLLNSLAVETLRQLPYFKPQELANSLWAYATLKYNPMLEWLGQIGVACEGQVGGCKPQELSSMLWALGSLKHHPGAAFLRTATETARRQMDKFKPGEMCNLVWGLAQLGPQCDPSLLRDILQASDSWSEGFGPVEVSRLLWGAAVLDGLPKAAAGRLYDKLAHLPLPAFTAESLDLILQVDAFLECSVGSLMYLLPAQLQGALQLTLISSLQQHKVSQTLLDISEGLGSLGVPHSAPYILQDGPLLVDVAILGPCPAIALQIEDPGQLSVNAPWLPLGSSRLKQQTLRCKGWQVVSVPFYIWNMLGTLPLRAAYLQQLLHICQALQFQPTAYSSRSQSEAQALTNRTYSNSGIERINSALTAQLSNSASGYGPITTTTAAAQAAASGYGPITTTAAAARAAACPPRHVLPAAAAPVHQQPQLKEAGRQLSEQPQYSRMYQNFERMPSSVSNAATAEVLWGRLPSGLSQPLQMGHFGEVTHPAADKAGAAEAAVTPRSASWDLQRCASNTAALQQGAIQDHGRPDHSQQGQGRSMHEGWARPGQGQGQLGAASAPLDAAQLQAVNALQSLARQLQATGLQQQQIGEVEPMHASPASAGQPQMLAQPGLGGLHHPTPNHPAKFSEGNRDNRPLAHSFDRSSASTPRTVSTHFEEPRMHSAAASAAASAAGFCLPWHNSPPNFLQSVAAHRPPWELCQAQPLVDTSYPCVVLQAAGYAPGYGREGLAARR